MRGRKPKPEIKGNVVAGPFPGRGVPVPIEPDWLTRPADGDWGERAARLASFRWQAAVAEMTEMQTYGPENAAALEMLAVNYARWKLAEAHVTKHGPIVPAPRTGVPMRNPYLEVANGALERVMKIETELGLSPTSRGRVAKRAGAEGVVNPWSDLLREA